MSKHWYVLRVQSGREDSICKVLDRRIESKNLQEQITRVMVPKETITESRLHEKGTKTRKRKRKIFPGYIMAEIESAESNEIPQDVWFLIKETPGIGDFLGSNNQPHCMREKEVDDVLRRIEGAREPAPTVQEQLERGAKVKIIDGAFQNWVGTVEEVVPSKKLIKVLVDIWGRPTSVPLELWQVEPTA